MPQSPLGFNFKNSSNALVPGLVDAQGALEVSTGGISSALNLAAGAHVVKANPGRVAKLIINTASTAACSVNDCATTGAVAASNLVFESPATTTAGTVYVLEFPCANGIVVTVGTAGVASVSFS